MNGGQTTSVEQLNSMYQEFFGRNADAEGISFWGSQHPDSVRTNLAVIANKPSTPEQVTPFLNAQQKQDLVASSTLNPNTQEVTDALDKSNTALETVQNDMAAPVPTAPNTIDTFNQLREDYGVSGLEGQLTELKSYAEEVAATTRLRTSQERGKRVGLGVIAGRTTEVERQGMEEMDFVNRQINTVTNHLNTAYGVIDSMIKMGQQDFENAMLTYNTKLNNNIKMYEILNDNYRDIRDTEERRVVRERDWAISNLQIYAEMVTSGSLNYSTLDNQTKTNILKLEIQSGLGEGFLAKLDIPLASRIREIGTRVDASGMKWADVIVMGKGGEMTIQSTKIGQEYVASMYSGGSSAKSTTSATASASYKAAEADKNAWNSAVQVAQKALDSGAGWSLTYNRLSAAFPSASAYTIDTALGVPASRAGDDGWKWWQEQGGKV